MAKIRLKLAATLAMTALMPTVGNAEYTFDRWGNIGYVDRPSALAADPETIRFSLFSDGGVQKGRRMDYQLNKWVGVGVQQSYQLGDKLDYYRPETSLDLRLNLLDESDYLPAVSVGMNDIFGTGRRSGEYIVATKTIGEFEASAGLGWGAFANGYGDVGDNERYYDPYQVTGAYLFDGDPEPFFGFNYKTPFYDMKLVGEYSDQHTGNSDDNFRFGLTRDFKYMHVGIYKFDNESYGINATFRANPNRPAAREYSPSVPITVVPRSDLGTDSSPSWYAGAATSRAVGQALVPAMENEGFKVQAVKVNANHAYVEIVDRNTIKTPRQFGRMARLLAKGLPGSVEDFTFILINNRGIPTSEVTINRSDFENVLEREDRVAQSFEDAQIRGGTRLRGDDVYRLPNDGISFDYRFGAEITSAEDKDGRVWRKFYPNVKASVNFDNGLALNAKLGKEVYGGWNQDLFVLDINPADSDNYARQDIALFRDDIVTLNQLTADYHFKLGRDLYAKVSGGYLETQFAGVNVEAIYAPAQLPFAFGINHSTVKKRDPENQLAILEKTRNITEATVYWDTGFQGLELAASYGKYLDEDTSSKLALTKKFANGWSVEGEVIFGEEFGDTRDTRDTRSSVTFSMPLSWAVTSASTRVFDLDITSENRGFFGNSLDIANPLYDDISKYDSGDYKLRWGGFWQ